MVNFKKELITHFFYWLFKTTQSGLNDYKADPRDFDLGIFGWGATYQPKNKYKLIPTRRVIDQKNFNICQWCATTTCKEVDEGVDLAERSIVCKGKQLGYLTGNGYSNLDAGEKVTKDWGIVENGHFNNENDGNWYNYTSLIPNNWMGDAALHKISSHWNVSKRGDVLKLLDDGKILKTAILWFTGFNQGGGFASRGFLMDKFVGYSVGGHCFACKGYILGFKGVGPDNKIIAGAGGRDVYVFQNSYGPSWGLTIVDDNGVAHRGLFFATMDFFDKEGWAFKATMDTPVDVAKFINDYNGKNVKCIEESGIWLIKGGQKHKYSTPAALAKSGTDPFVVSQDILNKTPTGASIN